MAWIEWTDLPTDYQDAVWNGNRKYKMINNSDDTVSFEDVTEYSQKENSFFGADDANAMNAAMNKLAGGMNKVDEKVVEAEVYADGAFSSAEEAKVYVSRASQKATEADNSARTAANSAATASQKARAAANSASAAENSASTASQNATAAANSASSAEASAAKVAIILFDNAGAHNAIFRGKNLGTEVTAEQWAAIANGTFSDMYIGDYWVINNKTYRIASFDYYYTKGDSSCTTHHAVIVPDNNLYNYVMNDNDTTDNGYVGSKMYTTGLDSAKTTIKAAFGEAHILNHRQRLVNAVTDGVPSGSAWFDSTIELMTEQNVYGSKTFASTSDGSSIPSLFTIDYSQYPLFAFEPSLIANRQTFWLRDVVTTTAFANVYSNGQANSSVASRSYGVRPSFCIC